MSRFQSFLISVFTALVLSGANGTAQTLGEALWATNLSWSTTGPNWLATTNLGDLSAGSGVCQDNQSSTLETTVVGPGWLYFGWMVSCEPDFDGLSFWVNDVETARISGALDDWQWREFYLPGGTNRLRWIYAKDGSLSAGSDRGWVQSVDYYPEFASIFSQPQNQNAFVGQNIPISIMSGGNGPQSYRWFFNSNLVATTTNSVLWLYNVQTNQAGYYHVVVSNGFSAATSSVARLRVYESFDSSITYRFPGYTRGRVNDILSDGQVAFVIQGGGLAAYGVSNLANISFLSQTPADGYARSVKIYGTNAYVAESGTIRICDISNPAAVVERQRIYLTNNIFGLDVVGNRIYVAGYGGFDVYDITDPNNPVKVAGFPSAWYANDVQIVGNIAYVASGNDGLVLYDISNPQVVNRLSVNPTTYAMHVQVVGNLAYVADNSDGIKIFDVSQPSNVIPRGAVDTIGYAVDIQVEGNFAYVADHYKGLKIFDVSNPANIILRSQVDTTNNALNLCKIGGKLYVAEESGFEIFDVSSVTNAVKIGGRFDMDGGSVRVLLTTNRLYLADGYGGFSIFDRSNPASPSLIRKYSGNNYSWNVTDIGLCGSNLIAAVQGAGYLHPYDMTVETNIPSFAPFYFTLPEDPTRMQVVGNLAYIAEGYSGLQIVDVSKRTNLVSIARYDTPGYAYDVQVVGNRAYVADGSQFHILDISNPTNIVRLGGANTYGGCYSVELAGDLLYVANWYSFQIYDVSNPAEIVLKGESDGYDSFTEVHVTNNLAAVVKGREVRTYDISDPTNPVRLSTYLSPYGVNDVQFGDNMIYVTERENGLSTLVFTKTAPTISTQPQDKFVVEGNAVSFTGNGNGTAPLSFQWRRNGTPIPGATNSIYTINKASTNDAGSYDFVLSNTKAAVPSSAATLTVQPITPPTPPSSESFAAALETIGFPWSTAGDATWTITTNVTHDGEDAAQSGTIIYDQSSILETSLTGPGVLFFWWKVSSEEGYDFLHFYIGNAEAANISGEVDWQQRALFIPAGAQTVRWVYSKDYNVSRGLDRGWLDQVRFVGGAAPIIVTQPASVLTHWGSSVSFSVKAVGDGMTYQWFLGTTPIASATNTFLTIPNVQLGHIGDYHVVITNLAGSATTSTAALRITPTELPKFNGWQISNGTFSANVGPLSASGELITETSTNLTQWTPIQTNAVTGTNMAISIPVGGDSQKFFRLIHKEITQ